MNEIATLIYAVSKLIAALAWPALLIYVVWRFGPTLESFLTSSSELGVKAFGVEATVRRHEAVAAIAAASIAKSGADAEGESNLSVTDRISSSLVTADALVTQRTLKALLNRRILWVDDKPENNNWECRALEALGAAVTTTTSTESAIGWLRKPEQFDLIISDMSRPEGNMAGYDLLRQLQKMDLRIPLVIYAGSSTPEQQAEARARGAFGRASDPEALVALVRKALSDG